MILEINSCQEAIKYFLVKALGLVRKPKLKWYKSKVRTRQSNQGLVLSLVSDIP